uniref:Fucolectin tachylectin-4 pentraxin-1 domain-containing protein n=1 Tax=Takifugu rubripes TaxID=31033 RepID=A0A3B5K159_TAKRU
ISVCKVPAVQSSEKDAAAAGRAVDGNRDPAERSTCTLTQSESGPWWRVDLQDEYKIGAVAITSVDDKKTNLDGVEIWIGISERLNDINNIGTAAETCSGSLPQAGGCSTFSVLRLKTSPGTVKLVRSDSQCTCTTLAFIHCYVL